MLTLHVLQNGLLAVIVFPGFVYGALLANYAFDIYGIRPTNETEANIIVGCTAGIMVTLLAIMLVARLAKAMAGLSVERSQYFRPQVVRRVY
jgi:hypothetical protein